MGQERSKNGAWLVDNVEADQRKKKGRMRKEKEEKACNTRSQDLWAEKGLKGRRGASWYC